MGVVAPEKKMCWHFPCLAEIGRGWGGNWRTSLNEVVICGYFTALWQINELDHRWNNTDTSTANYSETNLSKCQFVYQKFNTACPGTEYGPPQWETGHWLPKHWYDLTHCLKPYLNFCVHLERKQRYIYRSRDFLEENLWSKMEWILLYSYIILNKFYDLSR